MMFAGFVFLLLITLGFAFYRIQTLQISNRKLRAEIEELIDSCNKSSAKKTNFLATASHDLQQPHQALGLFLASLNTETLDLENTRIINKAKDAHETTSRLLNQLLDISRLDIAKKPQLQPLALHELVHAIGMKFLPVAACYGVELRIRQRNAYAKTDAVMLERMITNILLNAFRHAKHSNILLSMRKITLNGNKKWRIEIYDSGMGIPQDKQEIIFQEFTKLGRSELSPSGLGLGLAIVQRLSKLLNHPVGLRSVLGRGSCFYIQLDAIKKPENKPERLPVSDSIIRERLKVAVLNENEMLSDSLHTLLSSWGCQVKIYPSSYTALQDMQKSSWRPDALIVDGMLRNTPIDLAHITDIQTLSRQNIAMVMVAEKTNNTYIKQAQDFGFAVIASPIDTKLLRDILGERL